MKKLFRKKERSRKDLIASCQPSSFLSEQFRVIRTILLRKAKEKGARTILVTSTLPQEGKTFIASNLAVSIAQEVQSHVIIIDSDLRNPSLHSAFGLGKEKKGLKMFFANGLNLSEVIHKTDIPNLSIIPSGYSPNKKMEIISSERMKYLLEEIKRFYKDCYIIVDSGPVQLLADSLVMSEIVDGVVFVIKIGETKRSLAKKTADIVGRDRIIGVILNYCELPTKVNYKYYKYYSGIRRGQKIETASSKE